MAEQPTPTSNGTPAPSPESRSHPVADLEPHSHWMLQALREAEAAASIGEVPVGAVVVHQERAIARAHNLTWTATDPSAHAEMLAVRKAAAALSDWRLEGATLYVTLEPCAMCAGAIVLARVSQVVFGAYDPKAGMCGSLHNLVQDPRLNHRVSLLGGVLAAESTALLQSFFRARRR